MDTLIAILAIGTDTIMGGMHAPAGVACCDGDGIALYDNATVGRCFDGYGHIANGQHIATMPWHTIGTVADYAYFDSHSRAMRIGTAPLP